MTGGKQLHHWTGSITWPQRDRLLLEVVQRIPEERSRLPHTIQVRQLRSVLERERDENPGAMFVPFD